MSSPHRRKPRRDMGCELQVYGYNAQTNTMTQINIGRPIYQDTLDQDLKNKNMEKYRYIVVDFQHWQNGNALCHVSGYEKDNKWINICPFESYVFLRRRYTEQLIRKGYEAAFGEKLRYTEEWFRSLYNLEGNNFRASLIKGNLKMIIDMHTHKRFLIFPCLTQNIIVPGSVFEPLYAVCTINNRYKQESQQAQKSQQSLQSQNSQNQNHRLYDQRPSNKRSQGCYQGLRKQMKKTQPWQCVEIGTASEVGEFLARETSTAPLITGPIIADYCLPKYNVSDQEENAFESGLRIDSSHVEMQLRNWLDANGEQLNRFLETELHFIINNENIDNNGLMQLIHSGINKAKEMARKYPQLARKQVYIDEINGKIFYEFLLLVEINIPNGRVYSFALVMIQVKDNFGGYYYLGKRLLTPRMAMENVSLDDGYLLYHSRVYQLCGNYKGNFVDYMVNHYSSVNPADLWPFYIFVDNKKFPFESFYQVFERKLRLQSLLQQALQVLTVQNVQYPQQQEQQVQQPIRRSDDGVSNNKNSHCKPPINYITLTSQSYQQVRTDRSKNNKNSKNSKNGNSSRNMRKCENNKDNNVSNRIWSPSVNISSISGVSGVSGISGISLLFAAKPQSVNDIVTLIIRKIESICEEHPRGFNMFRLHRIARTLCQGYKLQQGTAFSFSFQVATTHAEKSKAKESKENENEYANENVNDEICGMIGCRCDSGVTEQDKINGFFQVLAAITEELQFGDEHTKEIVNQFKNELLKMGQQTQKVNDLDNQITVASLNEAWQRSMKSFEIPTIRNGNSGNNSEKNDVGGDDDDMVKKFKEQGVGTDVSLLRDEK